MPVTEFLFYSDHAYQKPIHKLLKAEILGLAELNEETGWRITQKGRDFLAGNIKIPNYVVIFKDQLMPPDHEGWIGCEQLPRPIGIDEVTDRVKRDREYYREQKREAIHA